MAQTRPDVSRTPQTAVPRVAVWQRLTAAALLACSAAATPAAAGDWVFRPSYYSHEIAPADRPLPSPRTSYRVPSVGNNPGFSVRGRSRVNVFTLRNGRGGFDRTVYYRGGVELDP